MIIPYKFFDILGVIISFSHSNEIRLNLIQHEIETKKKSQDVILNKIRKRVAQWIQKQYCLSLKSDGHLQKAFPNNASFFFVFPSKKIM